jgi:diaminopimelate decarboxylase
MGFIFFKIISFNYNGKLKSSEILLNKFGNFKLIRRSENIDDYLNTIIFE